MCIHIYICSGAPRAARTPPGRLGDAGEPVGRRSRVPSIISIMVAMIIISSIIISSSSSSMIMIIVIVIGIVIVIVIIMTIIIVTHRYYYDRIARSGSKGSLEAPRVKKNIKVLF